MRSYHDEKPEPKEAGAWMEGDSEEPPFPRFSEWAASLLGAFAVILLMVYVAYPLLEMLLDWLELNDLFQHAIKKARAIRRKPEYVVYALCFVFVCIAVHPLLAAGNRIRVRVVGPRRKRKRPTKKTRIV